MPGHSMNQILLSAWMVGLIISLMITKNFLIISRESGLSELFGIIDSSGGSSIWDHQPSIAIEK